MKKRTIILTISLFLCSLMFSQPMANPPLNVYKLVEIEKKNRFESVALKLDEGNLLYMAKKTGADIDLTELNVETNQTRNIVFDLKLDKRDNLLDFTVHKENYYFLFPRQVVCYNNTSKQVIYFDLKNLKVKIRIKDFFKIDYQKGHLYLYSYFQANPADEKIKIVKTDSLFNVKASYFQKLDKGSCDPFGLLSSQFKLVSMVSDEGADVAFFKNEHTPVLSFLDSNLKIKKEIDLSSVINLKDTLPQQKICAYDTKYQISNTNEALNNLSNILDSQTAVLKISYLRKNMLFVSVITPLKENILETFADYIIRLNDKDDIVDVYDIHKLKAGLGNFPFLTFAGSEPFTCNSKYIIKTVSYNERPPMADTLTFMKKRETEKKPNSFQFKNENTIYSSSNDYQFLLILKLED